MNPETFRRTLAARFPVWHSTCGEIAFYYTKAIKKGDPLYREYVVYADGSSPTSATKAICGHCGRALASITMRLEKPC